MLMNDAMKIIDGEPNGFMVSFERREGSFLVSDHFPDKCAGEPLIPTEDEAWTLARQFAAKTRGRCINIYVICNNYAPVIEYKLRMIKNTAMPY